MLWDLTVRTPADTCDLVPFLRRDAGVDVDLIDWEKPAAMLALHCRGWTTQRIADAVGLSYETVHETLLAHRDSMDEEAARRVTDSRGPADAGDISDEGRRYRRRLAQRVIRDGRWFHPGVTHGRRSAYSSYGCRCVPCSDAAAVVRRERRGAGSRRAA